VSHEGDQYCARKEKESPKRRLGGRDFSIIDKGPVRCGARGGLPKEWGGVRRHAGEEEQRYARKVKEKKGGNTEAERKITPGEKERTTAPGEGENCC